MLVNYMEEIVSSYLDKVLKYPEYASICKCDYCRDDIKAMALNNLNPFTLPLKEKYTPNIYLTKSSIKQK